MVFLLSSVVLVFRVPTRIVRNYTLTKKKVRKKDSYSLPNGMAVSSGNHSLHLWHRIWMYISCPDILEGREESVVSSERTVLSDAIANGV